MKYNYAMLALSSLAVACSKSPDPTETAVNRAVGSYACKVYHNTWSLPRNYSVTTRLRDTVLLLSKVDARTIAFAQQPLTFQEDVSRLVANKYPQYPYCFVASYDYALTQKVLQLDAQSDSLFYQNRTGGRISGDIWTYYGKKQL
jgi:hypothetical protein